jgi:mannose-6-phosphate isomerase
LSEELAGREAKLMSIDDVRSPILSVPMTPVALRPLPIAPLGVPRRWAGERAKLGVDLSSAGRVDALGDADPEGTGHGIGEWWLLCQREGATSTIAAGPDAGRTLAAVIAEAPGPILGKHAIVWGQRFPLLLKILDTARPLSIQVHPDHTLRPGEGKSESWYFLQAAPGAPFYLGLKPGMVAADLVHAAAKGDDPVAWLQEHVASAGMVAHVPAGTVHALGGGLLLLEIQENSGTTFRIHDWGRAGTPLHLEEALAALAQDQSAKVQSPKLAGPEPAVVVSCGAYRVEHQTVHGTCGRTTDLERFEVLVAIDDGIHLLHGDEAVPARRGNALLIPAMMGAYELHSENAATLLRIIPGDPVPTTSHD